MAALRNTAIGFLRITGATSIAETVRGNASQVRTLFTRLGVFNESRALMIPWARLTFQIAKPAASGGYAARIARSFNRSAQNRWILRYQMDWRKSAVILALIALISISTARSCGEAIREHAAIAARVRQRSRTEPGLADPVRRVSTLSQPTSTRPLGESLRR
jgi:hypothetical protein